MSSPQDQEAAGRRADLDGKFSTDPDALAWARGHVERLIAKYRRFEHEAVTAGNGDRALQWRKFANLLRMELVGGSGCAITPFDERRPSLPAPGLPVLPANAQDGPR